MADKDVTEGQIKQGEGKVQNAWGNLTGDVGDQVKGAAKQAEGAAQEGWGNMKDDARAEKARHDARKEADTTA